ncbi:MAG TPA: thiamine pyrophosphokinase, partial [Paracoccaceae bacterium]|nr:thiamine pyrophosphokinase [Paracoccaceae bacterium]
VAVIGDMDSISEDAQASIPADRLHAIAEQDSTDFDKCLRSIAAPLVLGVGFMGGRMDHALATLNVLVRRAGRPVILVGEQDICFHCPPSLSLSVPVGTRISLFPMAEVTARSRGLRWALDGITFQPWGRSGTSNEAEAPEVRIDVSGRGMMVIMSPDRLDEVMKALLAERVD